MSESQEEVQQSENTSPDLNALTGDSETSVIAVPVESGFIETGSPHTPNESQSETNAQTPLFIQFVTEDGVEESEYVYELVAGEEMEEGVAYLVPENVEMQNENGTISAINASELGIKVEPGTGDQVTNKQTASSSSAIAALDDSTIKEEPDSGSPTKKRKRRSEPMAD